MKYIKKTTITALFIILLIGITGVGLTGCSEKPPADSSNQPSSDVSSEADLSEENSEENLQEESDILEDITVNYIDFERVNPAVLSEEIKNIIEANKQEAGYRLIDTPGDYYYLIVFAGQKPNSGYDIKIKKVIDSEGITEVMVTESSPAEGMMSAQVLTYPFDVVKLTGITDNINLIYLSGHPGNNIDRSTDRSSDEDSTSMLENTTESEEINSLSEGSTSIQGESTHKAEESKTVPVESIPQEPKILPEQSTSTSEDSASIPEQSTSMLATRYAEGEFLGYVDQESVKIRFGGKNQLFFLTGRSREELKSFQVGERIGFDYLRNKEGQYILYSLNKDKQYVTGDFSRQLDRYSIEVIIEDGPVIFQLNDEAFYQLDKFQKGELVRIEYTQDQEGQMVANQLLKVPNE